MWIPWPSVQRARIARRLALSHLYEFHEALDKHLADEDPGARWQDMHNVSALIKARAAVYQKHQIPLSVRAAMDFSLVWDVNANANPLVFWMLLEISRDPILLEQIRDEISPYVRAVQPKNEFGMGVWISPALEMLEVGGLANDCPLLKAAYAETMRLYTGAWSWKWMQKDAVLKGDDQVDGAYLLKKGAYAYVPHELHHLDPKCFPNPGEWQPMRHVEETVEKGGKAIRTIKSPGCMKLYDDGQAMGKGSAFVLQELLMHTAAILAMYEIRTPEGEKWTVPRTVKHAVVKHPAKKVVVWIKRRELPTVG